MAGPPTRRGHQEDFPLFPPLDGPDYEARDQIVQTYILRVNKLMGGVVTDSVH